MSTESRKGFGKRDGIIEEENVFLNNDKRDNKDLRLNLNEDNSSEMGTMEQVKMFHLSN